MNQLWGWTAKDMFNRSRPYQAYGPDVTEAAMLEHLQKHFPNVTITGLKRLEDGDYIPAVGPIESHTYHHGHYDRELRANGITPYTDMLRRQMRGVQSRGIERKPIERVPIIRPQ